MEILITESAADDIAEAYLFYEMQHPGLGDYFESSILTDIRSLLIYAGVHEVHFKIYFRKITPHFPFAIYYTLDDKQIYIHAVIDTRKKPSNLDNRFLN